MFSCDPHLKDFDTGIQMRGCKMFYRAIRKTVLQLSTDTPLSGALNKLKWTCVTEQEFCKKNSVLACQYIVTKQNQIRRLDANFHR